MESQSTPHQETEQRICSAMSNLWPTTYNFDEEGFNQIQRHLGKVRSATETWVRSLLPSPAPHCSEGVQKALLL